MKPFKILLPTLAALLLAQGLLAQGLLAMPEAQRADQVHLAARTLDLRGDVEATIPADLRHTATEAAARLVKLPGPVGPDARQRLEEAGYDVLTYLPHDTFLVRPPVEPSAVGPSLLWSGTYHPFYKLSPALGGAAKSTSPVPVLVQWLPGTPPEMARRQLSALGLDGQVVGSSHRPRFPRYRLLLPGEQLEGTAKDLARLADVFYLYPESRRGLLNDATSWVGQSGTDGGMATPLYAQGLFGEGQVVAVLDTGLDPDMCFFRDDIAGLPPTNPCDSGILTDTNQRKVLAMNFLDDGECAGGITSTEWDTHDHGTHVAGTVAGDNITTPGERDTNDGMAPAARLVIQDGGFSGDNCADLPGLGCPVVDLLPIFEQARDQGAHFHTNSWGDAENAATQVYTAGSQDADEMMWNDKEFLMLFAAGNGGAFAGSVSSPSNAKNVISVGATGAGSGAESMASFSSCGFTEDGRIKPDLTLPGSSIVSANSDNNTGSQNCNTRSLSGTSMSTPATAGFAALARQYFTEGFHPSGAATPADAFVPSGALLKATLLGSTRSMDFASDIPSSCQGWGRLQLDDALFFSTDTRRLWLMDDATGFTTAGEAQEYLLEVGAGEPLVVVLTWTDPPSNPAASIHLINDLDLELEGPSGTFRGNVFASGFSTPGGDFDRLNPVEQIRIESPVAGTYTLRVNAFALPTAGQPFALVAVGAVASATELFTDGFEDGTLDAWSTSVSGASDQEEEG